MDKFLHLPGGPLLLVGEDLAVDRGMEIMDVRLLLKDGGKTGLWTREEQGE